MGRDTGRETEKEIKRMNMRTQLNGDSVSINLCLVTWGRVYKSTVL